MKTKNYLVGTAIGGVMEHPQFIYEKLRTVQATSEEEAKEIYKSHIPTNYWFPRVLAEVSYLKDTPLTSKKVIKVSTVKEDKQFIKECVEENWFNNLKVSV